MTGSEALSAHPGRPTPSKPTRGPAATPRPQGTAYVNRWVMPLLAALLMFGTIGVAQASGNWVTSGRTAAGTGGGGAGDGAGGSEGTGSSADKTVTAGTLTSADLKGWMTLAQAADGLGMPLADLITLIAPPAGSGVDGSTAFKDLETLVPGFSLTDFRPKVDAALRR